MDLTSTVSDILAQFVVLDADHDPADSAVNVIDATHFNVDWPDGSRVRIDVSCNGGTTGGDANGPGVSMVIPPPISLPGGTNPNNPPLVVEEPPVDPPASV